MSTLFTKPRWSLLAAATGAALLTACGGGGSDSSASDAGPDDATATSYAANATTIASDAASATDSAVLAAQAMVGVTAAASAGDGMASALSVHALATTTRACPGGGTATVSITGGTPASQANGQLDAGEVYAVSFAACAGAAGVAALDGTLAMTVLTATGDTSNGTLALSLMATDLSVTLPRGAATLNGTLALNCLGNCSFAVGDSFTILDASSALSGSFASVTLSGFGSGAFSVLYDLPTASVRLLVTEAVTAVPEPGSYALLLAGMAAVGMVVRRRQRAARPH